MKELVASQRPLILRENLPSSKRPPYRGERGKTLESLPDLGSAAQEKDQRGVSAMSGGGLRGHLA